MTGSQAARRTPSPFALEPTAASSTPGAAPAGGSEGEASTRGRIPAHLRRYVVEQNYAEYNAVDQAVWRFVLTQIYDTLQHTAHPAYETGLAQTGISVDRIPRIEAMDRCLRRYGWGAVCVDGFIPPRAFVEFQALGILPIAADMRTRRHLVYTPAPDIIHEAAGHAPILPDPAYAAFLKRIGHIGSLAFSSPEDHAVYRAIYRLSEVKERPDATAEELAQAERSFNEAVESVTRTTEAARMSRLYWWTAEYGLVGTPTDYKLYGAGLLSSLGESHSCHRDEVRKLPLGIECLDVAYDITRPQPQLFVARNFEHLEEVLDEASRTLAAFRGGLEALQEAELSGEVATVRLDASEDGKPLELIGVVLEHRADSNLVQLEMAHPAGVAVDGSLQRRLAPSTVNGQRTPAALVLVAPPHLRSTLGSAREGDTLTVELDGGSLHGNVDWVLRDGSHRALLVSLTDARLGDRPLPSPTLLVAGRVLGAHAGASDPAYHPASLFPERFVPEPRRFDDSERALLALYERAAHLAENTWGTTARRTLTTIHDRLRRDFADEWLLRWSLLELLLRRAQDDPLATDLHMELERLEVRFAHAEPIALGLRYLARSTAVR